MPILLKCDNVYYLRQPTTTIGGSRPARRANFERSGSNASGRNLRTQPQKRDPRYLLTFTTHEVCAAKRRKDYLAHQDHSHNLRSAVEATVRSVKHPFPAGKLPVRGQFRVTCMAIASAATTNVRRIQRYQIAKMKQAEAAMSP